MTTIRFEQVSIKGVRRWHEGRKCRQETKTFMQTINPFNKNADGRVKSRDEIMRELLAERKQWLEANLNRDKTPVPIPPLSEEDIARFWSNVEKTESCWIWKGTLHEKGYGIFNAQDRRFRAHRVSLVLAGIDLPVERNIHPDHTCRNRACIRPDHIELISERENILRGNSIQAKNARKTHCKWGHPFNEENTQIESTGARKCKICIARITKARDWSKYEKTKRRSG